MFKLLVICGCLLAIANVGVFAGGWAAPAAVAVQPAAIALPSIAAAPIVKAPLIASAPWAQPALALGSPLASPLGLGLKLG